MEKNYLIKIAANEDCWINKSVKGDPGRTLIKDNATRFTKIKAQRILHELRLDYPNRKFEIVSIHDK